MATGLPTFWLRSPLQFRNCAKIYFRFQQKFSYENNENFHEKNFKKWIFFIKLESTLSSGLCQRNFSFICLSVLKFYISHVRMAIDGQDRTGQSVWDLRTGHEGQERLDRAMKT
jgi:hypothetical protein